MKYGATSQPLWCAASALSKVSESPQQRQVYVGMIPGGNVLNSIGTAPSLRSRLSGSAWARQDCPRSARRFAVLTRPARSLEISNYRSDGHHVAGEVSSGPGAAAIPFRGERFAASRVFKWVVKKTPKFRHNLGQ